MGAQANACHVIWNIFKIYLLDLHINLDGFEKILRRPKWWWNEEEASSHESGRWIMRRCERNTRLNERGGGGRGCPGCGCDDDDRLSSEFRLRKKYCIQGSYPSGIECSNRLQISRHLTQKQGRREVIWSRNIDNLLHLSSWQILLGPTPFTILQSQLLNVRLSS